jgi:3-methyl-2-oxobutanoate hydroxymethyltransferase
MKRKEQKIVMITAYDYPSGKYAQLAEVDMILVGDSLGMVVLGYPNTLKVTMEDIIHHAKATRRGASDTFIAADMPFMSYHVSLEETKKNAARLILEADANAVKLEGGSANRLEVIRAITDCEIPVVAHLGLTPQSINTFGGYVVQGKKDADSEKILQQARDIQEAGAFMLVLEGIPEKLGQQITKELKIPTIGIGAGRYCDGQVLVYHDILGMADFTPKFVKKYANLQTEIPNKLAKYVAEVRNVDFPGSEHIYFPI